MHSWLKWTMLSNFMPLNFLNWLLVILWTVMQIQLCDFIISSCTRKKVTS